MNVVKFEGIEKALNAGCVVRGFLSGGGLRVVRIEKDDELKGYGEHPEVDIAIEHANEDYLAGGRKYEETYGEGKIYTHYLTGSLSPSSKLDAWILKRRNFYATSSDGEVTMKLTAVKEFTVPREKIESVLIDGIPQEIKARGGYIYHLRKVDNNVRISVTSRPEGVDHKKDWFYNIQKIGKGTDFHQALEKALIADEIEA